MCAGTAEAQQPDGRAATHVDHTSARRHVAAAAAVEVHISVGRRSHPKSCQEFKGLPEDPVPAVQAQQHRSRGCVDTFHGGVHEENGGHAAPSQRALGVASTPIVPAGAASRSVNGSSASSAAPAASIFWKEGGFSLQEMQRHTPHDEKVRISVATSSTPSQDLIEEFLVCACADPGLSKYLRKYA